MSVTTRVINRTWAGTVLTKLGRTPSALNSNGKKRKNDPRADYGYAWHDAAQPQNSQVGSRIKTNDTGVITAINIAGRPVGKHGGNQGQHTTAFGANREVVLAATIGRKETQARADIAYLFEVLADYPAFKDASQPKADSDLLDVLNALANPNSNLSTSYSVEELSTLYLEVRDALPGASLNTGVTSSAAKSSRKNIVGKGEGTWLAELRRIEEYVIRGNNLDDEDEERAVECMFQLYDAEAEASADMSYDDAHAQQVTFLKTIAQAFPRTFLSVGLKLVRKFYALVNTDATDMQAVCRRLSGNNTLRARPQPKNFAARLSEEGIEFIGRSDSVKDAGTMGDHTCAEQLMKNAATSLLRSDGKETTNNDLIGGLQTISNQFQLKNYEIFNQEIEPEYPAHMVEVRYSMLEKHHLELDQLLERLVALQSDVPALKADIIEAAEVYMQLVDDRPTAVHYDAPARGHGEPLALFNLGDIEKALAKGSYNGDRVYILDAAFGLLDCGAVLKVADMMSEYARETGGDEKSVYDTCIGIAANEFLFFFRNAYPRAFKAATLGVDETAGTIRHKGEVASAGNDEDYEGEESASEFLGPPRRSERIKAKMN